VYKRHAAARLSVSGPAGRAIRLEALHPPWPALALDQVVVSANRASNQLIPVGAFQHLCTDFEQRRIGLPRTSHCGGWIRCFDRANTAPLLCVLLLNRPPPEQGVNSSGRSGRDPGAGAQTVRL